jgi:hypothetical protein
MLTAWSSSVPATSRRCFGYWPCRMSHAPRSLTHQLGGNGRTLRQCPVLKDLGQ